MFVLFILAVMSLDDYHLNVCIVRHILDVVSSLTDISSSARSSWNGSEASLWKKLKFTDGADFTVGKY